jgi:hypothetical protein
MTQNNYTKNKSIMPPKKSQEEDVSLSINEASLKKLKVTELKAKLVEHDLDTKGVKDELIKRLLDHFNAHAVVDTTTVGVKEDAAVPETDNNNDKADDVGETQPLDTKGAATLSEVDKAKLRAERFGLSAKEKSHIAGLGHLDPQEEYERRKKRAERFGLPIPTNEHEEKEKKKARAQRFGLPVEMSKEEIEAKKKERQVKFMSEEEKKKIQRAQRFGSS